jgi:hypothetical protein
MQSHDLHALALRFEAEHHALAQAREMRCISELERRRNELAREHARLLARLCK